MSLRDTCLSYPRGEKPSKRVNHGGVTTIRWGLCMEEINARLLTTPSHARDFPGRRGFTMIELLGVLAIIATLAALVTVSVITRIDQGERTKEALNLSAMADSYSNYILKNKSIPDHTQWASAVSQWMALPVGAITDNARRYTRAFLIDTNLSIGGARLPYTQTTNGTSKPVSARVMIVSSLGSALPVSSGVPSSTNFNAIWNTAAGAKPSGAPWNSWVGKGEDLFIQRLNLEPLFYQLILLNHTPSVGLAKFDIDGSPLVVVPSGGAGWSKYYLDGTVVGLHTNEPPITRYLMSRSISFVYEANGWRGFLTGGQSADGMADGFSTESMEFFASRWNDAAGQGASQYSVMVAMYSFMFQYILWSNECPHFTRHGNTGSSLTSLPEYDMLNNIGQSGAGLDKYSDHTTGLLKPH